MRRLSLYPKNNRWLVCILAIGVVLSTFAFWQARVSADEADLLPDISDDGVKGKDADSLQDLEKTISTSQDSPADPVARNNEPLSDKKGEDDLEKGLDEESSTQESVKSSNSTKSDEAEVNNALDKMEKEAEIKDNSKVENISREKADIAPPPEEKAEPPSSAKAAEPVLPEAPAAVQAQEAPPAPAKPNAITNLEFKMEGPNSRVIISTQDKVAYRQDRNAQTKQFVFFFENTQTAQRLQRAYDTSEFNTPVALFTLLQMPGDKPPLSKLIIQLREDKDPTVTVTSTGLVIEFPPPSQKTEPRILIGEDDGTSTEDNIYAVGKTFKGKHLARLEIKNSDVQDVIRLIAKSSGYNVVIGEDVVGKVGTLSLENIPWDQAFALVLQSKKLGYVRQGNVLRVGTLAALKGEKEDAIANEAAKVKVEPLRTVLIPVSYAKAAEMAPRGKSFLTDRGVIESDVRTNTIIVKDVDKVVTRLQKLYSALDIQPARVSISARIVEIDDAFNRAIGFSQLNFNPTFAGINLSEAIAPGGTGGTSVTTINAANFGNLLSTFQLGETDNKVKILANPSVAVVANQQATVNQSISFFIPTTQVVAGSIVNTNQQITANLSMDVTPIVAGDGSIFLTMNVTNQIPQISGDTSTISGRNVSTQVLIDNGDTAVLGGIFSSTITTDKEGVPFLMHIPILGFFFQRNSLNDTSNEIYVFVTAKIMNPDEAFKRNF
jgi:type IV pilus assembly protein PilQ